MLRNNRKEMNPRQKGCRVVRMLNSEHAYNTVMRSEFNEWTLCFMLLLVETFFDGMLRLFCQIEYLY